MEWYQPIIFPDGTRTSNPSKENFFNREDLGEKKWDKFIKPYLVGKEGFLDIGCNAGLNLILAEQYGYRNVYGIENIPDFIEHCKIVKEKFNSKAVLYERDAIDFEYFMLNIDTTIMTNSLYWFGYSDSGGYIKDWDAKIDHFLKGIHYTTKRLIIVGLETLDRFGGKLELTLPLISKHFDIVKSEVVDTGYRLFNLIVADTKAKDGEIELDYLIKEMSRYGEYNITFIESFNKVIAGYIEHSKWMAMYKEPLRDNPSQDNVHQFYLRYIELLYSIIKKGQIDPVIIEQIDNKLNIDGWHRTLIMKALGHKTIKYTRK
jgi:SAM-dependent methyltransferase